MYSTLAIIETSVAALTKKMYIALSSTEVSIASIVLKQAFLRTFAITETSVVTIYKMLPKTLAVTEVSIEVIEILLSLKRLFAVTEASLPVLDRSMTLFRMLDVISTSVLDLITHKIPSGGGTVYYETLAIIEASITGISHTITFARSFDITEASIPAVTKQMFIVLLPIEIAVASIDKTLSLKRVFTVVENSIVTVTLALALHRTFAVVEASVGTLSRTLSLYRTLSITEVSNTWLTKTNFALITVIATVSTSLTYKMLYKRLLAVTTSVLVYLEALWLETIDLYSRIILALDTLSHVGERFVDRNSHVILDFDINSFIDLTPDFNSHISLSYNSTSSVGEVIVDRRSKVCLVIDLDSVIE
jgi:hypothetical protein